MNEEFYSIGRGSLNINGKFYCGLDYQITDFMRSLEEENQQLKETIIKAIELIKKCVELQLKEDYLMNRANLMNYNCNLLNILEILTPTNKLGQEEIDLLAKLEAESLLEFYN